MNLLLKSFKYLFLTPFLPLRMFREYDEEERQSPIAFISFFIGTIVLSIMIWGILSLDTQLKDKGLEASVIFMFFTFCSVVIFLMAFMIIVAAFGGEFGGFYGILILMSLTLLPKVISFVAMFYMDYNHVYLNWMMTIWQVVIGAMGLWIRHIDNLTKASIASAISFLCIHAFDQVLIYIYQNP
ncbi:MAG: hypothetical protein R2780_10675 [Crocinitomicaceae bacterium]|nr:hypothetical protein [Crocinitomicaceae bacterium]